MAWTAQVAEKKNLNGIVTVNVQYTDGVNTFGEVIDLSGGDVEGAKTRVRNKLSMLNSNDALFATIPVGFNNFTAAAPSAKDNFISAMRTFQRWQRAVELGLATVSDTGYTTAQQAMISAWNTSFIDAV